MHDTVMESTENVVESLEVNHITASFLAGRSSSDSPCSESVSRNTPITTWSDDYLFSEEASSKREACTSTSTSRISHSSSEQTEDLATMYGLVDLIPDHPPNPRPDQRYVPNHATTEGKLPLGKHMGVMDSTESGMGIQRKAGDSALGESQNPNGRWSRGSKAFACPYFRLDPIRHIECLSRKVSRIQDVKQHLARRHYVAQTESQAAGDNIEGVSPSAQNSLKVRVDRRLPPEGQWYVVWNILFKRTGPELGPYMGNTEEEVIGIAHEICRRRSIEAVSRFFPPKAADKKEDQEDFIPLSQVQSPSSRTGSLPLHGLPGLEDDLGSISEGSVLTLYNESHRLKMPMHDRVPTLGHLEEPGSTFNQSPGNWTEYNSLASAAATPESSRCSEPLLVPPESQRLGGSYIWKCHECAFDNHFTSGKVCQNYPCQHQYYLGCCETVRR